jgi:ankyrin repeat protein
MVAAELGHEEIVALLVEHGADVDATIDGETALMLARKRGHRAVVRLLEGAGGASAATTRGRGS